MKNQLKILLSVILIIANIICITIIPSITIPANAPNNEGSIVVTILEQGSNKPIDNATICVIETKEYFATNKNGVSEKITLPILKNKNLDNSLNQNWGEITLLAYKPGYSDHILFSEPVPINQTRYGLIIHLTPIYSSIDTSPTISVNKPDTAWVNELIKLYNSLNP